MNDTDNWSISVEWLTQDSAGTNQGNQRLAGPSAERTSFEQTSLVVRGPISENWTLGLLVPRIEIHKREVGNPANDVNLQGLGDLTLYGEYGSNDLRWLFGVTLPTGDEAESPAPGLVPPSLLQLGTGTINPLIGMVWDGGDGEGLDPYFDAVAVLPFDDSDAGLQAGHTITARAGALWRLDSPLTPGIQLEMVRRTEDRLNGSYLANTGATLWTLVPSLQFPLGGGASGRVSFRMPLEQDVEGTQLVPGQGFVAEVGWVF